ncbi:unnamed protein product [Ranitomeya imitator]|uniref:PDZ domain-containing protein n=1 Tax=Ranitomeya imitator TaxID=111125 RepID=A0ABN9LN91_9NEOB|nr:unnamed protein product [Ranitomeya imitator]
MEERKIFHKTNMSNNTCDLLGHGSGAGVLCSALLRAEDSTAVRRRRKGQRPGACALQYFVCPQQGRAKYACAGAVAEDQKRTSWKEDRRRRSGPETPIRPDQQRDCPWHPVTWQASKDGDRLIGRVLLNKRLKDGSVPRDSGAMLGLKVVGGKMSETGHLCAYITKVKKGSLADTVGRLRPESSPTCPFGGYLIIYPEQNLPGSSVVMKFLEWNGRILQGATFEEVYNIILESKPEAQVELVVSRPIGDIPRIPDSTHAPQDSSSSSFESQKMDRPSISVTSPMSPGMLRDVPQFLSGQLSSQSLNRRTAPFVPRVQEEESFSSKEETPRASMYRVTNS